MNHTEILLKALEDLSQNKKENAVQCILNNYRHNFIQKDSRKMSDFEKLKIFINDGFIDRYTGKKLFFPNVLRILSMELGDVFPYQKNWKMSDCHIAYWEFLPTYDHIVPIARGGKDEPSNIVTTSQMMNSSKSGFLLEEIGFKIQPAGDMADWDGMIHWYLNYIKGKNIPLSDTSFKSWHRALEKCVEEGIIS
ncbi:MAG: HNH endonuclease [Spirochaetaceae bacterium]|nr:HNH endonuclease [Spirochaetaceae bacterium]